MDQTPPQTPQGWYPDPSGAPQQRYWDGTRWTESVAAAPLQSSGENSTGWAALAHLSALIASLVGLAFIGPLIVYLVKKDDPFVRRHAAEALNFNLSVLIYAIVGGIVLFFLILVIVGLFLIPLAIAAGIAWLVLVIIAGVKASRGEEYRYPLTIRFVD